MTPTVLDLCVTARQYRQHGCHQIISIKLLSVLCDSLIGIQQHELPNLAHRTQGLVHSVGHAAPSQAK